MRTARDLARAITHARVEVRTPSLAPKHRREHDHVLKGDDVPGWHERLEALLTGTRVNGAVTLLEHVAMTLDGDAEGLARVREAGGPGAPRAKGAPRATLFLCGDGFEYVFDPDLSYDAPHRRELHALVVSDGARRELGLPMP
jgi:hypothetical protein